MRYNLIRPMHFSLICLGMMACTDKDAGDGNSTTEPFVDADADGFGEGADCDDNDATVYPTAPELCDGIDNNCNSVVDEEPGENGTQGWTDSDGDGFGDPDTSIWTCDPTGLVLKGGDCDDSDASLHPDAEEVCDSIDNDCDGLVDAYDDNATGLVVKYKDADGDGHGSTESLELCPDSPGYVESSDDCDDTTGTRSPSVTEVDCDGIDNNCDDIVDNNVVPRDFSSFQDAVDNVLDGGTICLEAGTHADSLVDLTGRRLTIMGNDPANVFLDLSGSEPFFIFDNWDSETEGPGDDIGSIVIQDLNVSGGTVDVGSSTVDGALLLIAGGTVTVRNVGVEGITYSLDAGDLHGGLISAHGSAVNLDQVAISNLSYEVNDVGNDDTVIIRGGILDAAEGSTVAVSNLTVDASTVSVVSAPSQLQLRGLLLNLEDSEASLEAVSLTGAMVDVSGSTITGDGMWIRAYGWSDVTATELEMTGNTVALTGNGTVNNYGLVKLNSAGSAPEWSFDVMDVSDNDLHTFSSTGGSNSWGAVHTSEGWLSIDHASFYNNSVRGESDRTSSPAGNAYGVVRVSGNATLDHIDVRGTSSFGDDRVYGSGFSLAPEGEQVVTLNNIIVAGNTAESVTGITRGVGISVDPDDGGTVDLLNATLYGNQITGSATARGAGLFLNLAGGSASVVNTAFGANTAVGDLVEGLQVHVIGSEGLTRWAYNFMEDPAEGTFYGIDDPTGDDNGNITGTSRYREVEDADVLNWDFTVTTGSSLRNNGDPEMLDGDGGACDIGAYGGPGSTSW